MPNPGFGIGHDTFDRFVFALTQSLRTGQARRGSGWAAAGGAAHRCGGGHGRGVALLAVHDAQRLLTKFMVALVTFTVAHGASVARPISLLTNCR